jgi:hypothetical protein
MWSYAALLVLTSAIGAYLTINKEQTAATEQASAEALAANMATYRAAVVDYFSANPGVYPSVSIEDLKAAGVLPQWSSLYTQPATSKWANYRDASDIIYVYASSPLAVNITSDIAALSKNSILTGVYRTGDTALYSPVFGQTQIPLPPLAQVSIPNGSPLWIAMRK